MEASCRENLQQFLWHLFIWRTFGFGRLEVIRKLHSTTCIEEALDALNIFDNILLRGALVAFPVYGQFRIPTKKRLDILSSLHNLSEALSQRLSIIAIPFSQAKDIIAEYKIPYIPATGIVAWLIICDLAEYSLCLSGFLSISRMDMENPYGYGPYGYMDYVWPYGNKFGLRL